MLIKNFILAFFLALVSITAFATANPVSETVQRREINVDELKAWYNQKKPMTVLDARTKTYFDGKVLPNAKWLPADAEDDKILSTVPDTNSLIVVYCYSTSCPAGGWLYDKLISMGYKNVYEFHGGIVDWTKKGFPMIPQK
jgi:rhodanese-related sulfurtransferase